MVSEMITVRSDKLVIMANATVMIVILVSEVMTVRSDGVMMVKFDPKKMTVRLVRVRVDGKTGAIVIISAVRLDAKCE